jgi:competence protein ComEC
LAIAADTSIQYHTATHDVGPEAIELDEKTCYGVKQPTQVVTLRHATRIGDQPIALGRGASMTFLYADGSKRSSFNENSLVVRIDLGSKRILFMGDSEAGGRKAPSIDPSNSSIEGKLLACCAADVKADVLIVGHHGSKTSSRRKFLNAVGAKIFVVSAGPTKYATVVLPDAEIVTELENRGKVLRTDLEDDACTTSPDKIGPNADGNPGGCDNVLVTITRSGAITADYRRAAD